MPSTVSPQARASDKLVLGISTAYAPLGPRVRADLTRFMAGDHDPKAAHEMALGLIAHTTQQQLTLIVARLLVMVDDEIGPDEASLAAPVAKPVRATKGRKS